MLNEQYTGFRRKMFSPRILRDYSEHIQIIHRNSIKIWENKENNFSPQGIAQQSA